MMRARRIRGMAGALRETQQRVSGHVAVRRRFKTVAVETRGLRLHYVRVKLSCGQSHKVFCLVSRSNACGGRLHPNSDGDERPASSRSRYDETGRTMCESMVM